MSPNSIKSSQDLKKLQIPELKELASQIRKQIIDVVSSKGGHLASSLGAVELCIALHYVFDTPGDKIVFDVGHQAYAHKIITNRAKDFEGLRQLGGISGFPFHKESAYDTFSVGHASNAVSLSLGLACANRLIGDKSHVIAVIGDGSLSGGECFEALNNAGHLGENLLVIFNHNEMSISPSVGALSNYLNKIISLPIYNRFKDGVALILKKVPHLGKKVVPRIRKIEEVMKGLIVPGIFFEELGFRYFGPLDGHNLEALISALRNIKDLAGPKIVHVVTRKGKGHPLAEKDPENFHSSLPFLGKKETVPEVPELSYTDIFGIKLTRLARKNKKIIALTAAMSTGTGLCRFKKSFPERFFDVGIAEQHLVSFASGLAKRGLKPVVAVYSTFLQRAYDQLIEDVALQETGVVLAIDRAGLVGEDGPTHHGVFDISYLRNIPNFTVISPAYRKDLEAALEFSLKLRGPVAIRYPKGKALELENCQPFRYAKAEVIREGKDVAILALGSFLKEAIFILDDLRKDGIEPLLVNPRFVKPLDEELLLSIAQNFSLLFILEEGILSGGFGEAILEFYREKGLLSGINVERLGLPCEFVTFGRKEELLKKCGLDPESILEKIKKACAETKTYNRI
ncbi:MAG: 1-deoxy-D-xylulose-5-phosphate synthase [Candidatus Omnitrophica bacterium]|nr:1-deoxy-D-xylulose-5-phosphate synthase [Candidatus Omnitrophota bacterium]